MRRRTLATMAVMALATSALLGVLATPASAGGGLIVDLLSPSEPLTFDLTITIPGCDTGTFTVDSVLANGNPVTPVSVEEDPNDANHALLVMPSDTEPGSLAVQASCVDGAQPITGNGGESFAALAVTKVVEGTPPAGTTFQVHVSCVGGSGGIGAVRPGESNFTSTQSVGPVFAVDIPYGAGGGVGYVYTDGPSLCSITEPITGGASSTTITPNIVGIPSPDAFASTVTNTFPAELVVTFTG